MTPFLRWTFTEVPGALVATATGEVDMTTWEQFIADLTEAAKAATHHPHVVLDLTNVSYLGALGIHAIEASSRSMRQDGQTLMVVAEPGSTVKRVLDIAPPSDVPFMPSVDNAIAEARRREQGCADGGE